MPVSRASDSLAVALPLGLFLLALWCPVAANAQSDRGSTPATAATSDPDEDVETYELKFSRGLVEFGQGHY